MSEPTYSVTTERVYNRLPEFYRTLDAQNDWEFKKYISSITDQLNDVDTLVARLEFVPIEDRKDLFEALDQFNDYTRPTRKAFYYHIENYPTYKDLADANVDYTALSLIDLLDEPYLGWKSIYETSDLLDGETADDDWLEYIAQLTGANIAGVPSLREKRDIVVNNFLGYQAGSREALEVSIKSVLTGTKFSRVYPQRDGATGNPLSFGTVWDVLIVTKPEESPDSSVIINKIIDDGAKPAGVVLHHLAYTLIWSIMEINFPTWNSIEAMSSWENFELIGANDLPN